MRTRFKTLTIGVVLATAAMAGCSSTTGSSGAVQNAATASASSAASAAASSVASTAPAPLPDPVTPSPAPTEAAASPVASPTESHSASDSPQSPALGDAVAANNDVCAKYLLYFCGGIGASGVGTVFYASTTPFACGANMESSCNYLEVAPQTWNGDLAKCPGGCVGSPDLTSDWGSAGAGSGRGYQYCHNLEETPSVDFILHARGTVVGSGFANTSTLVTYCDVFDDAGRQVRRYTGGGMTDWSLPSLDELNALYYYTNRKAIGGFAAARYWSSSLQPPSPAEGRYVDFNSGKQGRKSPNVSYGIRPVRAF